MNQFPVNIGQSIMAPLKLECQFRMVNTQKVQNCGVQVVNVNRVPCDSISLSEFVMSWPGGQYTIAKGI